MQLRLEKLEDRICPATPWDNEFLADLNVARANPPAYGQAIGLNLNNVLPAPPLKMNEQLVKAATNHSIWMATTNVFAHYEGNVSPEQQIIAAGFQTNGVWNQSIAYRYPDGSPGLLLAQLIIDNGVANLGHRIHLLAMDSYNRQMNQVGIGFAIIGNKTFVTIDTGAAQAAEATYISRLYHDLLGRTGSAAEVDSWVSMQLSTFDVATSFTQSGEWKRLQNQKFIAAEYQSLLGRKGEKTGIESWLTLMGNGASQQDVENGFLASDEYRNHPVPVLNLRASLITRFYEDYLHRSPDADGLNGWVGSGLSPEQMAAAFVNSQEYLA